MSASTSLTLAALLWEADVTKSKEDGGCGFVTTKTSRLAKKEA